MSKIKRVTISGFRGILAPLTLDLTQNGKPQSALVYGRNGTGKSSVTDAWEWLRYGRIEHLAREGAGAGSYANFAVKGEETYVEIEFTDSGLGRLRLTHDPEKITKPKTSGDFGKLAELTPHPCHICFADLTRFVFLTKADRYDLLAHFMGFQPQVEAQKSLRRAQRQFLDRAGEGRARALSARKAVVAKVGREVETLSDLAEALNACLLRNQLRPPESLADLSAMTEMLRAALRQDPQMVRLSMIKEVFRALSAATLPREGVTAAYAYLEKARPFKEKEDELKGIMFISLYERGAEILDRLGEIEACPLCEQPFDGNLKSHVQSRLLSFKELKAMHDAAAAAQAAALRALSSAGQAVALATLFAPLAEDSAVASSKAFAAALENVNTARMATASFLSAKPAETDSALLKELGDQVEKLASAIDSAARLKETALRDLSAAIEAAEKDAARAQLVADFELVAGTAEAFPKQLALEEVVRRHEVIAKDLTRHIDAFAADCLADVSKRFEQISADVAKFFQTLEADTPGLGEPALRIPVDQDRAVVPEVVLHGRNVSPAYKYLSESQLNSFGLAVFLASVKRFNPGFGFILLDDVVNSMDGYKRPRLLRILKEHFSDKQILLLTHDSVWRDRIARELPGWARIHFKRHDAGIGPIMAQMETGMEEIERLILDDNARAAGQRLGPLMESELQDLCEAFEAEMKYNKRGEYTLEPLLSGLRKRVDSKLKPEHPLSKQLVKISEAAGFRNLCAHAKNPEIDITPEEMKAVVEAWKGLLLMIRCPEGSCGELPHWRDPDFACRCGGVTLSKAVPPKEAGPPKYKTVEPRLPESQTNDLPKFADDRPTA
jgi:hypothetical protein